MRRFVTLVFAVAWLPALALVACAHQSAIPMSVAADQHAPSRSGVDGFFLKTHRMTSQAANRIEHLTTWEPVGGPHYTAPGGDYSVVAPYLDWGITIQGPAAALQTTQLNAAGIISVYYTNPNRQKTNGPEYTSDETTFAHDCNNNRILITKLPYKFYLMDPSSPKLAQLWIGEVNNMRNAWGGAPQYIFEDTADHINYVTALPCNFQQSTWDAATNSMDSTLTGSVSLPIIYNAGDVHLYNNIVGVSPSVAIDSTTAGGLTEACFGNGFSISRPLQSDTIWTTTQAQILRTLQDGKLVVCHANAVLPGSGNTVARLYVYASYLLTFDPNLSLFSELYTTPSKLSIFPEIFLVPHTPLVAEPTAISQLQQAGGTYAREYADCDYYGAPVGPCAFVVNASRSETMPFPFPGKYNATLSLNGAGVLDGGTATLSGPSPAASMPPLTAVVALILSSPSPSPTP